MKLHEYSERFIIVCRPDGSIKGGEQHVHTGYEKVCDVPDRPDDETGPAGKQCVF